jgi:hypothetical protein
LRALRLRDQMPFRPKGRPIETLAVLGLQPGDLVQVRSKEEIVLTLDRPGKNQGLWFGEEMVPYCGGIYRVQDRVERLIDDRNGRMLEISRDCLILEGVVCTGDDAVRRWLCPRRTYPFWREAWLRRVEAADTSHAPND